MSLDTSGLCQFTLTGNWTEETIKLLNQAIEGWWGDWLEYADNFFSHGLDFSTDYRETGVLSWDSNSKVDFEDLVAFSAGGAECFPDLECFDSLEEREKFNLEIHQTLLREMKRQNLQIRVKYVYTYVEGVEEDNLLTDWTDEEILNELGQCFTLTSDGKKFQLL